MRLSSLLLGLVMMIPLTSFASTGMLDPTTTVDQLTLLLRQYDTRIKQLEAENAVLKQEIMKAGIKIPLADFSGAIATPLPTKLDPVSPILSGASSPVSSSGYLLVSNPDHRAFIVQIHKDWSSIQKAYSLPSNSSIAGYEFVQSGALDHVFVDISYKNTSSGGVYDAKILYQFEKKEYKRKLIGHFLFDGVSQKYITKSGANPFGGASRIFVRDPDFSSATVPPTAVVSIGTPSPIATSSSGTSTPSTSLIPSTDSTPILADINKAYNERRYLTTIALINTYLSKNSPNKEVLSILYRTYFIIGKYNESLSALEKLESISSIDRETACNAQVIATYSKNTSLVTKYQAICKK